MTDTDWLTSQCFCVILLNQKNEPVTVKNLDDIYYVMNDERQPAFYLRHISEWWVRSLYKYNVSMIVPKLLYSRFCRHIVLSAASLLPCLVVQYMYAPFNWHVSIMSHMFRSLVVSACSNGLEAAVVGKYGGEVHTCTFFVFLYFVKCLNVQCTFLIPVLADG